MKTDPRRLFNDMKQEYSNWQPAHRYIQKYIVPTRGNFDGRPNDGKKINHQDLLDSHATWCNQVLGSGMISGLVSPSRPWFKLTIADSDLMKSKAVQLYLDEVQARMLAVFSKSNFYGVLNSSFEEMGSFGTSAFSLLVDENEILRGQNYTSGEYFIAVDSRGRPSGIGREFYMTVGQLVTDYGLGNVSKETRNAFERARYQEWVKVCHLVTFNYDRNPLKTDNLNFNFKSHLWEEGHKRDEFLVIEGFHEFPSITPRWATSKTSDVYGRAPGWHALGDVKMLQKLHIKKFEALEKVLDPPVQVDSSVQDISVNTLPGGVSRVSSTNPNGGVRPAYQINPDLGAVRTEINETKQSIEKHFFTDVFLAMLNDGRSGITATEVVEIHGEKMLMLGPILERVQNEKLDPAIDRTFNILQREGALPEPPPELEGHDIKVEYISTMAVAQRMVGVTSIQQTLQFIGNLSGVYPEAKDLVDPIEAGHAFAELSGAPAKIIRSRAEINDLAKAREQDKVRMESMANAQSMINGAKLLSETEVGKNSALDQMLGLRTE